MILLNMPKESYHQQTLENLRAEKKISENLLLLIQLDDGTRNRSVPISSDSADDSLMFMLHDE